MQSKRIYQAAGCIAFVCLWSLLAHLNTAYVAGPNDVAKTIVELARHGRLLADITASSNRVLGGVAIATMATVVLGAIVLSQPIVGQIVSGPLEFLRPVPPIAWIPLAIMTFGLGDNAAIAIVALASFFPLWLATSNGLGQIKVSHLHAARSLGARGCVLAQDIVLPSVRPFFLNGLRVGLGIGWFSVVAAEMVGSTDGLGQGIQIFSLNLQIAELYAYISVIGLIGFGLNWIVASFEKRSSHWLREGYESVV